MTEMKERAERINNLCSDDDVFEGGMACCTWELGMGVGSDAGELQQAEVFEASKTSAPVSRWSLDLKSDSSTVITTYSAVQKAAWRPSVSNGMRSSSFPLRSSPSFAALAKTHHPF